MKVSTRNQIKSIIESTTIGKVNEKVSLLTAKRTKLSSVITLESAKEMSLKKGDMVTALFKASHVILSKTYIDGISARNQLEGTVEHMVEGMVNTEVTLVTLGGEHIVSIITNEAAKDMDIGLGQSAVAIIKSTDIIIAK
jgi:molybdate transport system regulatory protein